MRLPALILLASIIVAAAAGLAVLLPRGGPSQGSGGEPQAPPGAGGTTTTTTGAPGTGATSSPGPGPGGPSNLSSNIWERYDVIEGIVVSPYYDVVSGRLTDWPAERGGRPLAVGELRAVYNISLSTGPTIVLRISWGLMENQSFTAGCTRDGQEHYESFNNTYTVTYNMSWNGGYIRFEAHAINESALYWLHLIPMLWAPDTGYWRLGILGATVTSPTGTLHWTSPAAAKPMDPDMALCQPITTSQGDPLQELQDPSITWLLQLTQSYPVFELLPWEVFPAALAGLQNTTTTYNSGWTPGGTAYYDELQYTITPLGTTHIPGGNTSAPAWRLEFTTRPQNAWGNYTLTTLTVIPLNYNLTLKTLDNQTITIKYRLEKTIFIDWHTGQPP